MYTFTVIPNLSVHGIVPTTEGDMIIKYLCTVFTGLLTAKHGQGSHSFEKNEIS